MLNVGNNPFGTPLSFGPGMPGALQSAAAGQSAPAAFTDAVTPFAPDGSSTSTGTSLWPGAGNGPGGYIAQFMSLLFGAYTQLAQYVSGMFGTPPWGGAGFGSNPQPVPVPQVNGGGAPSTNGSTQGQGQGQSGPPGSGEHFYTSATASSWGDPHDSFSGTLWDGKSVDAGSWNNETSHPHLLRSNSFDGGFRIDTSVGAAGANGVTHNDSASVISNFGENVVTMNKNGSYTVERDGKDVQLTAGQAVNLGDGETVTLNANKSLTVVERNDHGGEITTTLASNGKAVNVNAQAQNVDLGGYLVREADGQFQRPTQGNNVPQAAAASSAGAGASAAGTAAAALPQTLAPFGQFEPYQPYVPSGSSFQAEQFTPELLAGV
jgi:hypothetical protein